MESFGQLFFCVWVVCPRIDPRNCPKSIETTNLFRNNDGVRTALFFSSFLYYKSNAWIFRLTHLLPRSKIVANLQQIQTGTILRRHVTKEFQKTKLALQKNV